QLRLKHGVLRVDATLGGEHLERRQAGQLVGGNGRHGRWQPLAVQRGLEPLHANADWWWFGSWIGPPTVLAIAHAALSYTRKILLVPLSQVTMMSPPLGVIGKPVAVSMYAISGLVASVPVSE